MSSLVRLFDYSLPIKEQISFLYSCLKIIDRGYLTNDVYVKKLEHSLESFFNNKKAICVTSGTSALQIIFSCFCKEGDHIIMPNNTFIATWQAARICNLNIHLVDTNETGIGICPNHLNHTLAKLHEKSIAPKAVVDVHIGGFISRYWNECKDISKNFGCFYLEDSAQAFGSKTSCGLHSGCIGEASIHSFHLTKVLTGGEGGLALCSEDMASSLRSLRQFGVSDENSLLHNSISLNSKMSEFTAAFILENFKIVMSKISKRRKLLDIYRTHLDPDKFLVYDDIYMNSYSSAYKTVVKVKDKLDYQEILDNAKLIPLTGFVYKYPLSHQPVVINDNQTFFSKKKLNNSISFSEMHICPPNYPELKKASVLNICDFLNSITH